MHIKSSWLFVLKKYSQKKSTNLDPDDDDWMLKAK